MYYTYHINQSKCSGYLENGGFQPCVWRHQPGKPFPYQAIFVTNPMQTSSTELTQHNMEIGF